MKETDTIVDCFADSVCSQCGEYMIANKTPSYRHQVFELPKTAFDITEYRIYNSHCSCCNHQEKGKFPDDASPYQIAPRLQSFIAYLSCGAHMSLSKIQQVLLSVYGTTFSIGALNEANQRTGRLLKPTAEDLHHAVQSSPQIFIDETRHNRNGEGHQRWMWLMSNKQYVFCDIKYFRNAETAKKMLNKDTDAVVITDQCGSYNWLNAEKHQFCWAHIKRNLNQMAEYSGGGYTAVVGKRLHHLSGMVFRIDHMYRNGGIDRFIWLKRMMRIRKHFDYWLDKSSHVPCNRYAGRCAFIAKHSEGLWVFLNYEDLALTNNEAERAIRGFVIMRKICFGTNSYSGEMFRSRCTSIIETAKRMGLCAFEVISDTLTAITKRQNKPDVFGIHAQAP